MPILIIFLIVAAFTSLLWIPLALCAGFLFVIISDNQAFGFGPRVRAVFNWIMLKVLFNAGPIQNWIWKNFYNLAFRGQKNPEITVLNYGYALLSDSGIYLEKFKDNINVLQYQMYDYLLSVIGGQKSLRGKTFIEVGCGRGGCFRYIVDEYDPARAIGVDISKENVNFCKVKQVEEESLTRGKYKS